MRVQSISAKCIGCFGYDGVSFQEEEVDVISARALVALAFECDDDTVLTDLLSSECRCCVLQETMSAQES